MKKKSAIRPSLTQWRSDTVTPNAAVPTVSFALQNASYAADHGLLARTSAAAVPSSSRPIPETLVRTNCSNGVSAAPAVRSGPCR